jgi:hypothetical protein
MKTKKTLSFLIFLLLIVSGKNLNAQKLTIEVFNKTGMDIDSLYFDKQYIGYLPKDSSAVLKNYKEFKASGSWPLMKIRAIDDKGNKSHNLTECGTKAIAIKKGRHRIDIKVANPKFSNILTLMLRD